MHRSTISRPPGTFRMLDETERFHKTILGFLVEPTAPEATAS